MNEENKTNENGQNVVNNPTMPIQNNEPVQSVQPTQNNQASETVNPTVNAQQVPNPQPVQSTQQVPSQPVQSTQQVPSQPVQTAQQAPSQPVQTVEKVNVTDTKPESINTVEKTEQPVEESTKTVEYVNPQKPTEVIKTKTLEVPKKVDIEPEPNKPIIASTPIEPNKPIVASEPVENTSEIKPKKNNNLLIIIVALVVLVVLGVVIFFTFFNKSKTPTPTPSDDPIVETPTVTLSMISSKLMENEDFNNLNISVEFGGNLIFRYNDSDIYGPYTYELQDEVITTSFASDDLGAMEVFLYLADAIGQINGNEKNETILYLSSINLLEDQVEGLSITTNENNYQISLNVNTKFDTTILTTMYFEKADFEQGIEFLNGSGTYQLQKGNLLFYKSGDENSSSIIIGEKNSLSSLTHNSIMSLIEVLYPDELEDFKTIYPEIASVTVNRYQIITDPVLTGVAETIYQDYQNDYKFIEIRINKTM